jgi:hypothetical protein
MLPMTNCFVSYKDKIGGKNNKGNDIMASFGGKNNKENGIMESVELKNMKYVN